jgi:hypothetical protein
VPAGTSGFAATIRDAYAVDGPAVVLGRGVHEGAVARDAVVQIPLAMMNRHGLVAGATGTGKTKTLQVMAEQLSAAGVPVFVADVKGDVSGLAAPGEAGGGAEKRMADLGLGFDPASFPLTPLALGGIGTGVPVRTTVSDFGPQLLAKVLDANQTQESSLALVFHYADAKGLPLLDLADLRALLTFLEGDEGEAELKGIGGLSKATVGVLLRSLVSCRPVAVTSSSVSPSSTSPTCCAWPTTGAASSRASSWRPCRTSRSCSRPR